MPKTRAAERVETVAERIETKDFEAFRAPLAVKRQQLLNLYKHDIQVGQEAHDESSDDFADRAYNAYKRELMFSLSDSERGMLIQVEEAIKRLDNNTYGTCDSCAGPIGLARLQAVPWARYCIDCQEKEELGILER